jgi:hypothetical protein
MKQVIGLSVFVILTATIVIPVAAQAELKPQVGRPTPNDMAKNTATLNNNTFSVPTSVVSDKSNRITRTTLPATIRGHAVRVATPTKQEASRAAPIMPRTLRMPAQASRQLSKHF